MKSSQKLRVRESTIQVESAQHTRHMQIKIYTPYVCTVYRYICTYIFMNMFKIQLVCEKSDVLRWA